MTVWCRKIRCDMVFQKSLSPEAVGIRQRDSKLAVYLLRRLAIGVVVPEHGQRGPRRRPHVRRGDGEGRREQGQRGGGEGDEERHQRHAASCHGRCHHSPQAARGCLKE